MANRRAETKKVRACREIEDPFVAAICEQIRKNGTMGEQGMFTEAAYQKFHNFCADAVILMKERNGSEWRYGP